MALWSSHSGGFAFVLQRKLTIFSFIKFVLKSLFFSRLLPYEYATTIQPIDRSFTAKFHTRKVNKIGGIACMCFIFALTWISNKKPFLWNKIGASTNEHILRLSSRFILRVRDDVRKIQILNEHLEKWTSNLHRIFWIGQS